MLFYHVQGWLTAIMPYTQFPNSAVVLYSSEQAIELADINSPSVQFNHKSLATCTENQVHMQKL